MTNSRFRLGRRWRQVVLLVHLVSGAGWMGVDLALAPLALTGLTTGDGRLAAACYQAIAVLVPATVPYLALAMTATGILLGVGTQWGLLKYWWVFVKLVLSLILTALVWLLLLPTVGSVSKLEPASTGDQVRAGLGTFPVQVLFPVSVSFTTLAFASVLGVVKPWGRTRWGTRPDRAHPAAR
ncbi:hypothetical protein [Arthrobacter mobilis]|uniref:DUF2269 domain-containing protein n=1 Tax=Arthrobacter mobilis TaxID=2724944 RepID=A0A7X6K667_9MICC|nr:hypothetical protein [Arthrobacter mobilis]NKX54830.1 hypothetical protein [Arthrobacter mobilis]